MKDKNTKFVICFFQSLNVVGYNYKNVPFETTRLIEHSDPKLQCRSLHRPNLNKPENKIKMYIILTSQKNKIFVYNKCSHSPVLCVYQYILVVI
jgi:hypothetical protein